MFEYIRIILPFERLEIIDSKEKLFEILDRNEREYLENYYKDLEIEEGFLTFKDGYVRKDDNIENWKSILGKIAKLEKKTFELLFYYDNEDEVYGYKAYPNTEVKLIAPVWSEI